MRQVTRKGLMTMAAAGGIVALGGGYAQAEAGAIGGASDSPGILSGNNVQAPVHVPVSVCGNTVNAVALLNPAMGNACANGSSSSGTGGGGGSQATGSAADSPGVASGNNVQAPVHLPVNACGNTVNAVALLNPAMGNACANGSSSSGTGDAYGEGSSQQGVGSQATGSTADSPGVASGNNVQAPIHVPVGACGNTVTVGGLGNATTGNGCANVAGPAQADNPGGSADSEDSGTSDQTGSEGTDDSDDSSTAGEHEGSSVEADGSSEGIGGSDDSSTAGEHEGSSVEAEGGVEVETRDEAGASGGQDIARAKSAAELAGTGTNGMGLIIPAGAGLLLGGAVLYRRARAAA
ncbi:chaplin [Streptomyces sp. MUM 178J]|uniref:chaplin n=1 Tax=Streptomyces sp. MUM 178J TaxID=2791991 RepID=UPI002E7C290E|nr:chaplin family protein [Streptomyces sp. MUM 178J]WRQ78632.1 chaplin family protein [Streptomyces sp. MUM 178J]